MLLDCGANINIVSRAAAEKLNCRYLPSNHSIRVASGEIMQANEEIITDITIGSHTIANLRFIVCHSVSHDFILGYGYLRQDCEFKADDGYVVLKGVRVDLIDYGRKIICTTEEDVTVQPDECCTIHLTTPTAHEDLKKEPIVLLENMNHGFLEEHDLSVVEGVYNNGQYIDALVFNPHSFPLTIPAGTQVATGSTMEISNNRFECNELVEAKDDTDHQLAFKKYKEIRKRKFDPETSDTYKKVHIGESLEDEKRKELVELLAKHRAAFSVSDADIGLARDFQFAINWRDEEAEVYAKPRPCVPTMRLKAREKIQAWREMGVIENSSSRNNIPLFFIKKGTKGDIRPILDCRAVNKETVANRFPIPHLKDLLSEVSSRIGTNGQKDLYISTTDIQSAFNQLAVVKTDRDKCSFSFQNRQYQAARCLFGLRNAPSAFCELMARVVDDLPGCFVLLDDIVFISMSWAEHKDLLAEFFRRCEEQGLTLKPSKTFLAAEKIDYLGFVLTRDGISPLKEKIDPIIQYPAPKTKRQLRRFIGLTNFYSRFVKNGSQVLAPLYKMCGNTQEPFRWQPIHKKAFDQYKQNLAEYVTLVHRDEAKRLVLITDGSIEGIAGALHQMDNEGHLEPLGFVSRSLQPSETRFASRYIEFLAIVWSLEQFSWEVTGNKVLVMTDHFSLTQIQEETEYKIKQPIKILNAHARLSRFEVDIIHRSNKDAGIIAIDALSRAIPLSRDTEYDEDENIIDRGVCNNIEDGEVTNPPPMQPIRLRNLARLPGEDIVLKLDQLSYSYNQLLLMQEEDLGICAKIQDNLCTKNSKGLYVTISDINPLILIPEKLARELISFVHATMGHPGSERLISLLRRAFTINNVHKLAREICAECGDCIICKPRPPLKHPNPPTQDFAVKPWDRFYVDLTDFGSSDEFGNRYFLGMMDHSSRFLDGCPIPNKHAETVGIALANLILRHNAVSGKIVLDNGLEMKNRIMHTLLNKFNISVSHIAPHHPCGNLIERAWRELGIKAKIRGLDRLSWSRDVPVLLFHMNNTPHAKLGNLAPAEVLTGRPVNLPCFMRTDDDDSQFDEYSWLGYLSRWLNRIGADLVNLNRDNCEIPEDPSYLARELQIGTKVAFWSQQRPHMSKKLFRQFGGVAKITKVLPNGAYEIQDDHQKKLIRNIKHLRPLPAIPEPTAQ